MFVILSCYFLSCQLFTTRSVKPSPGGRFLLFKNTGLVPQGGILGSCLCAAALDSLSEGGGREGRWRRGMTGRCLISGVLSHTGMWWRDWCFATDEWKTKRQTKWEFWEVKPRCSPSSFKVSSAEQTHKHNAQVFFSLSLCFLFPSQRGSVFVSECDLWVRWSKNPVVKICHPSEVWNSVCESVGWQRCSHQSWQMWRPESFIFTPPTIESPLYWCAHTVLGSISVSQCTSAEVHVTIRITCSSLLMLSGSYEQR